MLDCHCHIDMYEDPFKILNEIEKNNIFTIGMTNLPSHFAQGFIFFENQKNSRVALGLHPLLAKNHNNERKLFHKYLDKTPYIGEIGLDFSVGKCLQKIQIESFDFILKSIKNKNKILFLHSRKAEKEILELLKKYNIKNAVFHWYSGSIEILRAIIDHGYYFSINTAMINSKKGKNIIQYIPQNKILTETDGPYISINNKFVKPTDIYIVYEFFAQIWETSIYNVINIIQNNFNQLTRKINK